LKYRFKEKSAKGLTAHFADFRTFLFCIGIFHRSEMDSLENVKTNRTVSALFSKILQGRTTQSVVYLQSYITELYNRAILRKENDLPNDELNGTPFRRKTIETVCRSPAGFFGLVGGLILWFLGDRMKDKFLKA
jgi:hypothetical protein